MVRRDMCALRRAGPARLAEVAQARREGAEAERERAERIVREVCENNETWTDSEADLEMINAFAHDVRDEILRRLRAEEPSRG